MSGGRRLNKDLRRRPAFREPMTTFYIYCEGRNSEPSYFYALGRVMGANVKINCEGGVGVPITLAKSALAQVEINKKKRNRYNDQVWVVFDRDDHPRINDAFSMCRAKSIGIGFSNPCFEVWLIFHEVDYDRCEHRDDVQFFYAKLRPEYNRAGAKTPNCSEIVLRAGIAVERAKRAALKRLEEGDEFGAPSSSVYLLVEAIQNAAAKSKGK